MELQFRAMGSDVHVIVVGAEGLAERARARIDELEHLWSRFLPDSEISQLNEHAGEWRSVTNETIELITRAVEAWRFTGATFDPTVLGAVLRAGYTTSFDLMPAEAGAGVSDLVIACTDIEIDGNAGRLPRGTGFDPRGGGKGLAPALTAAEIIDAGADGVCINMGGDLRAIGTPPEGDGWTIAIEHPWSSRPIANVGIADGAVATSTTLRRRWTVGGEPRHHLIDPRTGRPSRSDVELMTVVAGEAWRAEVLATACLLRGSGRAFDILSAGDHGLAVTAGATITRSDGIAPFLRRPTRTAA